MVYVRICDSRQILDCKPKRYGTGTRIKHPYSRMLTVTVRSPTPDLNPIEQLWHHLKKKLGEYEESANSGFAWILYLNQCNKTVPMSDWIV